MVKRTTTGIDVLDDDFEFSLNDLCRCCSVQAETIIDMVEEGMLSPRGVSPREWRFEGTALRRVEITLNLQHDLGVNLQGAALALELLEVIDDLHSRIRKHGF